jgi:hypothetical protein
MTETTDRIVLHMDRNVAPTDPNILVTNLATNEVVEIRSADYAQNQLFEIELGTPLQADSEYSILLKFRSITTETGVYFHGYDDRLAQRSLLATRFLPILARTAL